MTAGPSRPKLYAMRPETTLPRRRARSLRAPESAVLNRACAPHTAGKHPGLRAASCGIDPRRFECLPGRLSKSRLLRIHRERLPWPDTKEVTIEITRVVHEATFARIAGAGGVGIG